jgi:hypothetical protein
MLIESDDLILVVLVVFDDLVDEELILDEVLMYEIFSEIFFEIFLVE